VRAKRASKDEAGPSPFEGRASIAPFATASLRSACSGTRGLLTVTDQTFASSQRALPQLTPVDADLIDRTVGVADFDDPFPVRFERVLDVARQPFGQNPGLSMAPKFLADLVVMRFAVCDPKEISRHCQKPDFPPRFGVWDVINMN
jgi:hypothetical protein